MRAQQLHYREYALRETTYDQDLFFLQVAFPLLGPDTLLIALLDRFGLLSRLQNNEDNPDHLQYLAIAEDFLLLTTILLTETSAISDWSLEKVLRRDIIHALALGQCSLTELAKRLPENATDSARFDEILATVARFRAPDGSADHGVYILKPECLAETDVFYFRYTRNQREETTKVLHEELQRRHLPQLIVPKPVGPIPEPFSDLSKVFCAPTFVDVLTSILHYSLAVPDIPESFMDVFLHLIMVALVNDAANFSLLAVSRAPTLRGLSNNATLVHHLVALEGSSRLESFRLKIKWSLECIAQIYPKDVETIRKEMCSVPPLTVDEAGTALEEKKAKAAARKAAIMQQFAQDQQAFISNYDLDDDADADSDEMMDDDEDIKERVSHGNCISCQEELYTSDPFGLLGLIQSSRVLRVLPNDPYFLSQTLLTPGNLDREYSHDMTSLRERAGVKAFQKIQ